MKRYLLILLALFCQDVLMCQLHLHPTTRKETKILRHRVLKNTDHGYFGVETGMLFDFSVIYAFQPPQSIYDPHVDNRFHKGLGYDFMLLYNSRIFGGYKWKSHYFELAYAGYQSSGSIRFSNSNPSEYYASYYGAVQLGYYYQVYV